MTQTLLVLWFQATVYLLLAPGVVGLLHWFKARLQGRRGADPWQPYRDLLKLLFRKRPNIPESASQVFLIAPPVIFVCYLLLGFFLPTFFIGNPGVSPMPWRSLSIDFIFVIYLLGLARFIAALAAFDAGAPFGSMSSGRQFYLHLLAEPALMIAVYALTLTRSSSNIDQLIGYNLHQSILATLTNPAMVLILLALSTVFLAESGRLPW